MQSVVTNL